MLPDIIEAYADAMYVATTLRSPPLARPAREHERFPDRAEMGRARPPRRLARRVSDWLRARFGRARGTTSKPAAPVQPGFIHAQPS
jgi:hypothetical protein